MTIEISCPGLNPSNSKRGVFPNLAARENPPAERVQATDTQVEKELNEAGIEVIQHTSLIEYSEVPTHFTGFLRTGLGEFRFKRYWYYWSVEGRVPLSVAKKMYIDPVGKKYVRCGGHCGCPPPAGQARRYVAGKQCVPASEREAFLDVAPERVGEFHFTNNPNEGEAFVECYHIDSQGGLNLFVQTVKAKTTVCKKRYRR